MLKFRPVDPDDEPFLRQLRARLDADRLGLGAWSGVGTELAKSIVELQFRAHAAHYQEVKSKWETRDNVVELNGELIGRFIVSGDREEVHLCDIVIDRRFRGMGIGEAILQATKTECAESKRLLRLHADKTSPVVQFYQRHGFRVIGQTEADFLMEWDPRGPDPKTLYFFPTGAAG